jgi:hypothetical protein
MTDTDEVIANQLSENTGVHFLDSGGVGGRAWQVNQARARVAEMTVLDMFKAQPAAWWDGYGVTLSTFHWMSERLSFCEPMQRRLDRWINLGWIGKDRWDQGPCTNSPDTIDQWVTRMVERGWAEPHPEFQSWTNTYNHDNLLSQDLQFVFFATTDEHPCEDLRDMSFVAMSTHNGADARGGYSDFKIYECDPWEMLDWDDFSAHCEQCESHPDPADTTLFDNAPYVATSHGYWWHRGGSWDTDAPGATYEMEPIFDPRYPGRNREPIELPEDFEQWGPLCPIHLCNMEV